MSCVIVQDGKVVFSWPGHAHELMTKHALMCKQLFGQSQRWGDQGCTMKRRTDPPYVVCRNKAAKRRLVLINLERAPADYLQQLCGLYDWPLPGQ